MRNLRGVFGGRFREDLRELPLVAQLPGGRWLGAAMSRIEPNRTPLRFAPATQVVIQRMRRQVGGRSRLRAGRPQWWRVCVAAQSLQFSRLYSNRRIRGRVGARTHASARLGRSAYIGTATLRWSTRNRRSSGSLGGRCASPQAPGVWASCADAKACISMYCHLDTSLHASAVTRS